MFTSIWFKNLKPLNVQCKIWVLQQKHLGNHCAYILLKLHPSLFQLEGYKCLYSFGECIQIVVYTEMSVNLSVQAVQMCSWILKWLFYHSAFKKIRRLSSSLILSRPSTRTVNPWDPLTVTSHVQMCGGPSNSPFQEDLKCHIFSLHLVKKTNTVNTLRESMRLSTKMYHGNTMFSLAL